MSGLLFRAVTLLDGRRVDVRVDGGRVVEVNATSGAELIREQVRQDENACMLGEVALVDGDSRVGRSGLVVWVIHRFWHRVRRALGRFLGGSGARAHPHVACAR